MKNFAALILIFFSYNALAQFSKGAKFLDGSASFSFFHRDDPNFGDQTSSTLRSSFSFGTTLNEKSFLFFELESESHDRISSTRLFDNNGVPTFRESTYDENIYSVSIGFENFLRLNEKLFFVPRFSGLFGFGKAVNEVSDVNFKQENELIKYSVRISPRLQYIFDRKWAITGSIGSFDLTRTITKNIETSDEVKETRISSGFGLNTFGLGIRFYLNNTSE